MKELMINVKCFNLKNTLECGQCFRWKCCDKEKCEYIGIIKDRVIKIRQNGNQLYITSNKEESLKKVIVDYFDLEEDYEKIEKRIIKIDENIATALKNTSGLHHLNQDFFETVISYIISANNNIPRISKSIQQLSKRYGQKVMFEGKEYYLFPKAEELKNVTIAEYRECGVGFRDSYIFQTVHDFLEHKITYEDACTLSTDLLRKKLLMLKGVGPKVADCILLFSCHKKEVFPIDVWVERIMSLLYFKLNNGKVKKKDILFYADRNFGEDAGIIQQHLFYNIREKMI